MMFKVILKDWAVLLPESFTETLTSLLEVSVDTLFISNDNESIYSARLRRTDAMLSRCRWLPRVCFHPNELFCPYLASVQGAPADA